MSIHIAKIVNGSKPEEEYVELLVKEDVNLGGFAIVDNTYDKDQKRSNIFRHIFAFPIVNVKKGDFLRVFSGKGDRKDYANKAKTRTYEFFWDAGNCVWNNTKDEAILIRYDIMQRFAIRDETKKK